ncbi:MAG: glycosyl hydrolase [Anaerolineales bacterium]|nr:glycosyl hydrolase [Anaerolineales bacterium]
MKFYRRYVVLILLIIFSACSSPATSTPTASVHTPTPLPTSDNFFPTITPLPTPAVSTGIQPPPNGFLYHGVFPGGRSGEEDDITPGDLISYEEAVGKKAAWVYFSNNWYTDRDFPIETAQWIRDMGSVPYIRLMLRPDLKYDGEETIYTLQNIIDGNFDTDLHAWCADARAFSTNLIVEYGTEVNSNSFVWSGFHNGDRNTNGYGDPSFPDGPERFRDAYRHIIQICRDESAENITWVFHMDNTSHPDEDWNRAENYYPGDEWIDWIGISIYGVIEPSSSYFEIFSQRFNIAYSHIMDFAPDKPVIVAEFGTAKNNILLDQVEWTKDAFLTLDTARYPNLIGFSWWNEWWQNDRYAENDTTMRVQDNPELEALFLEFIGNNPNVLGNISE